MLRFWFLTLLCASCINGYAGGDPTFEAWLEQLKLEASAQGVSDRTINSTFRDVKFLPRVIELDQSQPEFISTFLTYIDKRVTEGRVDVGRRKLKQHMKLLNEVERLYGVPKNIIVAFWGLETNYGSSKGNYSLPSALMTLAYEGRRAAFFRGQLIDMMHIVDAGHNNISAMHGSWAGATGHMQFMPSTFLSYATDADFDGRNDVWHSLPDAFSSAANYLSSIGWRQGEPVALEVKLPKGFDYAQANLKTRNHTTYWEGSGVKAVDGNPLPALNNTAVLLPQGWQGPAFLVTTNFDKVMQWNRSVNYALSVSHLANQFSEDKPIVNGLDVDNTAITFNQAWALQAKLNEMGYDSGRPDGYPGSKTKAAIRSYQRDNGLPQDGYASSQIFDRVMAN